MGTPLIRPCWGAIVVGILFAFAVGRCSGQGVTSPAGALWFNHRSQFMLDGLPLPEGEIVYVYPPLHALAPKAHGHAAYLLWLTAEPELGKLTIPHRQSIPIGMMIEGQVVRLIVPSKPAGAIRPLIQIEFRSGETGYVAGRYL